MNRLLKICILALLAFLVGVVATFTPYGVTLEENLGLGFLFRMRGVRPAPEDVVVIALDRESADVLHLPRDTRKWRRSYHAELVRKLTEQRPATIIFDVHFKDETADDPLLAEAIRDAGNVILIDYFEKDTPVCGNFSSPSLSPLAVERIEPPAPLLREAAALTATFPLPKVPARVSQFWPFMGDFGDSPSLPVAAIQLLSLSHLDAFVELFRQAAIDPEGVAGWSADAPQSIRLAIEEAGALQSGGRQETRKSVDLLRRLLVSMRGHPPLAARMSLLLDKRSVNRQGSREIKLFRALIAMSQDGGSRYLDFYGPPRTVATVPFCRVLRPGTDDRLLNLDGKVVFVGASDIIHYRQPDTYQTVFSQESGLDLSGVEIGATAFANLLEDTFPRPPSFLSFLVILSAVALSLVSIWVFSSPCVAIPLSATFTFFYGVVALQLFKTVNLWLPLAIPLLVQMPVAAFATVLWNYREVKMERDLIRRSFARASAPYLPEGIADQSVNRLQRNLEGVKDGELVYGVCLFTDIVGYTELSESKEKRGELEEIGTLLNEYYEAIFAPIEKNGGIILGTQGDAMLAVWASRLPDPGLRRQACAAALEVRAASDNFKQAFNHRSPVAPFKGTRVGLHAGQIFLGKVGSRERKDYTALGDIVNTASRVEGLGTSVGTNLLATHEVVDGLDELVCRRLGAYILKGKRAPVQIFELLGRGEATDPLQSWLCGEFARALQLCQDQQWSEASVTVRTILDSCPGDGPALYLQELCRKYEAGSGGEEWDGFFRINEK